MAQVVESLPSKHEALSSNATTEKKKKKKVSLVWWDRPAIPALGKLRQENCKFKANLHYIMRSWLKKQNKNKKSKQEKCRGGLEED
jgi:hypothetical protein